jgi:transcriptional regulator with XRE-family HTH domain
LRQGRQKTPLSQGDVAKKLGWSLSKVQRIEAAEVAVSVTDLRALLDVYGIVDPDMIARLSNDAQVSRRQRWVTPPEYREHLTPSLLSLLQFESEAVAIRAYQNVVIPGVLQTATVAEQVLEWGRSRITDEQRRVRFDVRMERRKQITENPHGPRYLLILDESVIKRPVGPLEVMAEQLEALGEVTQSPNLSIRVVPFEKGAKIGLVDSFQVLNLSEDPDDAVVYRESYNSDRIIDDPAEVRYCRDIFEEMWTSSMTEETTARAIAAEAARLRTQLDDDYRR